MGFDDELIRTLAGIYNHVEPLRIGEIISTDGTTATVKIPTGEMEPFQEVPILKPCFEDIGTMNLNPGDKVIVAFIQGFFNNPIVIGRI